MHSSYKGQHKYYYRHHHHDHITYVYYQGILISLLLKKNDLYVY